MRRWRSLLTALLLAANAAAQVRPIVENLPAIGPAIINPVNVDPLKLDPGTPRIEALAAPLAPITAVASASPEAPPADEAPRASPPALRAASALAEPAGDSTQGSTAQNAAAFDGGRPLSVLFAASEAVPFVKTGGLADVVDALSRGMAQLGHRGLVALPNYPQVKKGTIVFHRAGTVSVPINGRTETAGVLTARVKGVDVVLLDHPRYYDRPGGIYNGHTDNDERFAFYARAALEAARVLNFRPDIVHAHDWQAGLIPSYLRRIYAKDPFFAATKSVLTIHNIAFQGIFELSSALKAGFSPEDLTPLGPLEYWGGVSYLKAGLVDAHAVTTVSPTYAKEIVSGPKFGMGMEGVLHARPDGVLGIINGVDVEKHAPRTDTLIWRRYGIENVAEGKAANKDRLQERLGLERAPGAPLFAVASRIDADQKGIDLVAAAIEEIIARGGQVVVTGSGDKTLEAQIDAAALRHPRSVARHKFDETFVHGVYAGADFVLMPSRYEPCGLSQLIAMLYGTLPIVTPTGGLADTVVNLRTDAARGNGIVMRGFSMLDLLEAVEAAIAGYEYPGALAAARATAMGYDSSWTRSLHAYAALYRRLTGTASASRAANATPGAAASASATSSASDARLPGSTAR